VIWLGNEGEGRAWRTNFEELSSVQFSYLYIVWNTVRRMGKIHCENQIQVHLSLASRVGDKTEARMELEFGGIIELVRK
jgi:hypothetical protein